jgi:hypothetical protein
VDKVENAGRKMPGHGYVGKKYVEKKIRFLFVQEGTARTREDIINENFYSAFMYDILKDRRRHREETATLNHFKVKIVRLHSKKFQFIVTDKHEDTLFFTVVPFILIQSLFYCSKLCTIYAL